MKGIWLRNLGLTTTAMMLPLSPAFAQEVDQQDDTSDQEIVVTSMRVRQGGAQNVSHFRSIAQDSGMPRPEGLSSEGLMGDHDLTLPAAAKCDRMFCLVTEAMPAALPLRPSDKMFVGLGFASNIDAAKWRREPLNLVAVVDKSGSMSGEPLALVRASLRQIVGQMRSGDRISIILYGSEPEVYLSPIDLDGNRDRILARIDGIESEGATAMEEGLRKGYATAFADAPRFKGNTRVMLFTDEQPNVGATDADSFMGMAEEASHRGIGLTTIGVGVQFDDTLATRIASVRGGNMFFIADPAEVRAVFANQLDTMVSELAHDMVLTLTPAQGYKIAGVFGVPDGAVTQAPEGTITMKVPSVFLATNGGGIFVTLGKSSERADLPPAPIAAGESLLAVTLSYRDAKTGTAWEDRTTALAPAETPSAPLRKAHLLVDEYLAMREATTAFHVRNEPRTAYTLLNDLSTRMRSAGVAGMEKEQKLAGEMLGYAAFHSGYTGELPRSLQHLRVVGTWEITNAQGFEDLARGDRLEFTDDREMHTFRRKTGYDDAAESEEYQINAGQIRLVDSNLTFRYSANGQKMFLSVSDADGTARLAMRRIE